MSTIGLVYALVDWLKKRGRLHATIKQMWSYPFFKVLTKRYLIENGYYYYANNKDMLADLEKSALIERDQDVIRVPLQNIKAMEINIFAVPDDPSTTLGIGFYPQPYDAENHSRKLTGVGFDISPPRYASSEFDEFWNKLALCFRWEEISSSTFAVRQTQVGEMVTSPSEIFHRRLNNGGSVLESLSISKMIRNAFKKRLSLVFHCTYQN